MVRGRRSKGLWIAALLPLFGAAVLPTQISTLVCRFTGAIMDVEVCCPSDRAEQAMSEAQFLPENCCLFKTVDLPKLVSESRADSSALHGQTVLPPALVLEGPELGDRRAQARPVGPPPVGPPIILLKRSFLI
jgi:hypothetical protein